MRAVSQPLSIDMPAPSRRSVGVIDAVARSCTMLACSRATRGHGDAQDVIRYPCTSAKENARSDVTVFGRQGGAMKDASFERVALIVNAASRRGRAQARTAERLLRAAGVPLHVVYPLRRPERLAGALRRAVKQGCGLIVVGGGDGTVSSAADELAKSETVLAVLPLGTANDFAHTIGMATDLEEACAQIAQGVVVEVDLGKADDSYYVNVVTIGLGAEVARATPSWLKRLVGPLAYPSTIMRVLWRFRPFSAEIVFPDGDNENLSCPRLLQIAIGNGRYYGGGAVVAPRAEIDDGVLDVYAIEYRSWPHLVGLAWSFRSGRHVYRDDVPAWRTRRVRVQTRIPLAVNLDGELIEQTPAVFSVERHALRVLVPPDRDAP
jgi:diacylglycerol kinase (ATP)